MVPPVSRKARAQDFNRARMIIDRHAERLGNGVSGYVVVGGTDATGGEHVSVTRPKGVQRRHDLRLLVGHDADFLEIDADRGQKIGRIADVLVLSPAGKNLVADDE